MKSLFALLIIATTAFSGLAQKRTVEVGDFSELGLGISANVYVTQGSENKVVVECSDSDFEKIEFETSGDRLTISNKGKNWRSNLGNVKIWVTMKEISGLSVSGSGDIIGKNNFKTDDLTLAISGSGDIEVTASAKNVDMRISGSGSIAIEGDADKADISISGSGKIKGDDLSVAVCKVRIAGSGSVYMDVSEEIKANIAGSGSVYYSGSPKHIDSHSAGSGKVKKM